jgi:hypothetical protein
MLFPPQGRYPPLSGATKSPIFGGFRDVSVVKPLGKGLPLCAALRIS